MIGTRAVEYHQGQRSYAAPKAGHMTAADQSDQTVENPLAKRPSTYDDWRRPAAQLLTYRRQSCASLKPSTSRILRFDKGASNSPISRVTGVFGATCFSASLVDMLSVIVSFVALNTWKPSPSFSRHRRTISPRSRASI